jgi:Protein of unknown function (DUF2851)
MNEQYLHLLWRTKRLPMHLLHTIDNLPVKILHIGFYNTASGPDFFNGRIELEGMQHSGNIEMHVKSSDWYAHGHQNDEAYNNVILHVVYEHDRMVFIEGIPIPTVELKPYIDLEHFRRTLDFTIQTSSIPCRGQLKDCPEPIVWNQVEGAMLARLARKKVLVDSLALQLGSDPRKVLFHLIAQAFGMKTNALPFQELAHRIPFERIIKAGKKQVESIVFGASGLIQESALDDDYQRELQQEWHFQSHRLQIHPSNAHSWHFKGCRPSGFPTLRLAQFSAFIERMNWSESFWELPATKIKLHMEEALTSAPAEYWTDHYHFGKKRQTRASSAMSLPSAHVVIINSVVPFLWWLADLLEVPVFREKAQTLLELLPPEKNALLSEWKENGITAKSAAESQGLIELKNELCNKKLCLQCKIGMQLLKR